MRGAPTGLWDGSVPATGYSAAAGVDPASTKTRTHTAGVILIDTDGKFAGKLDMKPGGYLQVVPGTTRTNVDGVFAAGDVTVDVCHLEVRPPRPPVENRENDLG